MTSALRHILGQFRNGLQEIYGSRLAGLVLFGSQARGDGLPDSDIDVMIVLRGSVNPQQEIQRVSPLSSALSLQNDVVISCVYMSEDDYRNELSPLLLNVRREGVAV